MNKRIYNIENIRGVDITSSPINVASNRASHMINMINEGGTNVKRHGWEGIATFEHEGERLPINGIYEYNSSFVVHAGTHFYRCDSAFNSIEELSVEGASITSTKSKGYAKHGKLWIVGAGDYLIYDGVKIQPVMNSIYAYIPTTSVGVTSIENGDKRESFQGANLFSSSRINKLIGADNHQNIYRLDKKAQNGTNVTVEGRISSVEESILYIPELDYLKENAFVTGVSVNSDRIYAFLAGAEDTSAVAKDEEAVITFNNPIRIRDDAYFEIEESYDEGEKPTISIETDDGVINTILKSGNNDYFKILLNGRAIKRITLDKYARVSKLIICGYRIFKGTFRFWADLKCADESIVTYKDTQIRDLETNEVRTVTLSISIENRKDESFSYLKISFPCSPVLPGESNINVEFVADSEGSPSISSSGEINLSAGVNVLCLTNNKSTVYFSDFLFGYGYFPHNECVCVGRETEPVTSIVALDSGIGVLKENELYCIALDLETIDREYIVRLSPSVQGFYHGVGCDNEFLGLNVNGDTMIYNGAGVHGVISSSSRATNMRSTNVNKALCAYTREQRQGSFALSHQGRYYLFIEGLVYIADTRFKYYESNRLDSGFEYEWWIWDNCKCRCAYSFGGKLYMGTQDGEIRVFGDGYKDVIVTNIEADAQQLLYDGEAFAFDSRLYVEQGDKMKINNAYEKLNRDAVSRDYSRFSNWKCTLQLSQADFSRLFPSVLYEDGEITLYDSEYGELPCVITSVDTLEYAVYVEFDSDSYNDSASYDIVKLPGEYTVKAEGDGRYRLIDRDGEDVSFVGYEDISAVLDRDSIVKCEMRTGAIDLCNLYAKTLYSLSFTPTRETSGKLSLGYTTNLSIAKREREFYSAFDFNNYDFNKFTFDGGFFKTYIKRVFERNFNYIMFEFSSQGNGPFGIENAQAVYSINNELRSDR